MKGGESTLASESFLRDPNVNFPCKPCLRKDIATYPMPEGIGMQFRGGPTAVVFRGTAAGALFDYLLGTMDGTRDWATLLAERPAEVAHATLVETLSLLHAKGLLSDGFEPCPRKLGVDEGMQRQLLLWGRSLGLTGFLDSAEGAQEKLACARLALVGTGLFGAISYDLLSRSGCRDICIVDWDDTGLLLQSLSESPSPPRSAIHLETTSIEGVVKALRTWIDGVDIVVTATRSAPASLALAINRLCLDRDRSVLFGNDNGSEFELGPYVLPFGSACYRCMTLRKASAHPNMLEEHVYNLQLAHDHPAGATAPLGESVASASLGASHLVMETVRILTGLAAPSLLNAAAILSPLAGGLETLKITRVPRCTECQQGASIQVVAPGS